MRAWIWLSGASLALTSSLAVAGPEDLLPPIFNEPAPTPAPRPAQTARPAPAPAPSATSRVTLPNGIPTSSREIVQQLPQGYSENSGTGRTTRVDLPSNFPSLAELERMDEDEINQVLGLRPKFDIPPGAQRSLNEVGLIDAREGGFAAGSRRRGSFLCGCA